MDAQQFRDFGKASVDYLAKYFETIRERSVLPDVQPGYLSKLIPSEAPREPESWQTVLHDVEQIIMPGVTHWQSPNFHAFYPTGCSYESIVGEMISSAISGVGFSWMANPVSTELEVLVLDWLGKMLGLPHEFLASSDGPGGGVIQGSASEATLVCLLAARERAVQKAKQQNPNLDEGNLRSKFIAYSSDQSNSSVEKAGLLAAVPMKLLPANNRGQLHSSILLQQLRADREEGLIPIFVVATLGTTGTCAFDKLTELGPVCNEEGLWLHIDAAYAGTAFICPEYRHLMAGVEYADSFNFNPHKWMLVNFDCSALWVKDVRHLVENFSVERIYLNHNNEGKAPDFRHWQIPLGRRFRAMKLWFVLRLYGVHGIQEHVRNQIKLAQEFEFLVKADSRFEMPCERSLALICFRLKGPNELTQKLVARLTARRNVYLIAATVNGKYTARFVICGFSAQTKDITYAWNEICTVAKEIVHSEKDDICDKITC